MQDLALLDLALTTEGQGGDAAWRRAAIFADESGRAAWGPVAALMLGEVRDFTTALAAALPSAAGECLCWRVASVSCIGTLLGTGGACTRTWHRVTLVLTPWCAAEAAALSRPGAAVAAGGAGGGAAAVRWNVLRMSPSTGLRVISREQDLAAWNVRAKYYRWVLRSNTATVCPFTGRILRCPLTEEVCLDTSPRPHSRVGWCLRGLCGLTVAAQRGEDRFGVVLLCEPALPDIALTLLSAVLVLQHYTKFVVGSPVPAGVPGCKPSIVA